MKVGTEQEWQAARKELTASAGLARVGVESWEPSGSQDLALLAEPERRPLPFFEGVHPYHGTSQATGRPGGNGFRLFPRFTGFGDLPLIATRCNHGGP
jgi:hypothetical protein